MKNKKKSVKHPLLLAMAIYALIFLLIAGAGLAFFWNFIEAYENSRPGNALDAYISQLTGTYISASCEDLIAQVDPAAQTADECRQVIEEALSGGVTYARKSADCTDDKLVYVLRSGSNVIGGITLTPQETDAFGFSRWEVTQEHFDLSFLLKSEVSVTVPEDFAVIVNGKTLDSQNQTETDLHYSALEAFYGEYEVPTLVTYTAGPFLGEVSMEIHNAQGETVTVDEDTDYNAFLDNCGQDEARLTEFVNTFLTHYVAFTSSANKSSNANFNKLLQYVVTGSDLHERMNMALDGLAWAQSRGDKLVSITNNHFISIGGGKYICDVTYEVDTTGREGVVRTTNNARFVVVDNSGSLKVEMLKSY